MTEKKEITFNDLYKELLNTKKFRKCQTLKDYVTLIIKKIKENNPKNKGYERHHIIPRSICKELNLDCDFNKHNVVRMDHNSHIQAHNLLALSSKDKNIANQAKGCGCVKGKTILKHLNLNKNRCK